LSPVAIRQIAIDNWIAIPITIHHTSTGEDSTETPLTYSGREERPVVTHKMVDSFILFFPRLLFYFEFSDK
jgi:hypothetical protein